jgi:hypothetical protein
MNKKIMGMLGYVYRGYNEQIRSRFFYPDYFHDGRRINSVCIGWSYIPQWKLFKTILSNYRINTICVVGAYYGRDIGYLASIAHQIGMSDYHITGIDKFEDKYCEDWPEELRKKSWKTAGFGVAPQLEATSANMKKLGISKHVTLVKSDDKGFLSSTQKQFDFIYIDTSHDYKSVKKLIDLGVKKCKPGGVIGGDDYATHFSTWGVNKAVAESFKEFEVVDGRVWYADPKDYIKK